MRNIQSKDEKLKNIFVCEVFHKVAMDIAGPLPKPKVKNQYILVTIDHYSKWCETKVVSYHDMKIVVKFFEKDINCRYGVPKCIFIDDKGEWLVKLDIMCKDYGITHQHTTFWWLQCNGMVEHLIKMIKHGITIFFTTPKHVDYSYEQLAKIMFGYCCGVRANNGFFPFMILVRHTLCLKANNYLQSLTIIMDDIADVETTTKWFIKKIKLVVSIHENVLLNVEQTQNK